MGPRRHRLEKLFAPASIAVFGASEKPDGVGTRVFRNLIQAGYQGDLSPINPGHEVESWERFMDEAYEQFLDITTKLI